MTVLVDGQVGSLVSHVGSDQLTLEVFDAIEPLQAGDLVVTSSVSVTFPQGLAGRGGHGRRRSRGDRDIGPGPALRPDRHLADSRRHHLATGTGDGGDRTTTTVVPGTSTGSTTGPRGPERDQPPPAADEVPAPCPDNAGLGRARTGSAGHPVQEVYLAGARPRGPGSDPGHPQPSGRGRPRDRVSGRSPGRRFTGQLGARLAGARSTRWSRIVALRTRQRADSGALAVGIWAGFLTLVSVVLVVVVGVLFGQSAELGDAMVRRFLEVPITNAVCAALVGRPGHPAVADRGA